MKIPSASSLLAIGLAVASPALASNCRPSKPASSSVSSVSSASAVSSPSSVPSTSSTPPPICGVQLVAAPEFYDSTLPYPYLSSAWSPGDSSGVLAGWTCPSPHTTCGEVIKETSISQTVDTAAVGQDYSFSLYYYIYYVESTYSLVCTATGTPAGRSVPVVTSMAVPIGAANTFTWLSFNSYFQAVAETTTIACTFSNVGTSGVDVILTDVEVMLMC